MFAPFDFQLPFEVSALAQVEATIAGKDSDVRAAAECAFVEENPGAPLCGAYVITSGVSQVLEALEGLSFGDAESAWLVEHGVWSRTTREQMSGARISVDIDSVPDGSLVFPGMAFLAVEGPLWQVQLVSEFFAKRVAVLSSVATRFSRLALVAGDGFQLVADSSHQVWGAPCIQNMVFSACVGGATATTAIAAAAKFGISLQRIQEGLPPADFAEQVYRNRAWLESAPAGALAILDLTHVRDSVQSLARAAEAWATDSFRAATVAVLLPGDRAQELIPVLYEAFAQRNLQHPRVFIAGSFDESQLRHWCLELPGLAGACVDVSRIRQSLRVQSGVAALEEAGQWSPRMRPLDSSGSSLDPGRKTIMRYFDDHGRPMADIAHAANERLQPPQRLEFVDRVSGRPKQLVASTGTLLRHNVMRAGRRTAPSGSLGLVRERARAGIASLPLGLRVSPASETYEMGLTPALFTLKSKLSRGA